MRIRRGRAQTKTKPNPPLKDFFSLRPAVFSNDKDVTLVTYKPINRGRQICNGDQDNTHPPGRQSSRRQRLLPGIAAKPDWQGLPAKGKLIWSSPLRLRISSKVYASSFILLFILLDLWGRTLYLRSQVSLQLRLNATMLHPSCRAGMGDNFILSCI
jgi:hypothetical protein